MARDMGRIFRKDNAGNLAVKELTISPLVHPE
jgi:hypothetical protein